MTKINVVCGARLLKALSNEKRLEIVFYLVNRELKVHELGQLVGLGQSALSQHLAILRAENIVKTRRVAQNIFYSVENENAIKIVRLLEEIYS